MLGLLAVSWLVTFHTFVIVRVEYSKIPTARTTKIFVIRIKYATIITAASNEKFKFLRMNMTTTTTILKKKNAKLKKTFWQFFFLPNNSNIRNMTDIAIAIFNLF